MEEPLVSIGLPTRNRAHLLSQSLGSLLAQTYPNIEFILSDNASTDNTEQVIQSLAKRDRRIRFVRQKVNIGGNANHEFVLREAKGAYFMWASDDDSWDPHFVETLVRVLEHNSAYGVAMSHYFQNEINGVDNKVIVKTHYLTHSTHVDLLRYHLQGKKSPIFYFGLYRTDFLKKILKRHFPVTAQGPLLFLCEVALSTRMYSVPEILHTRFQDMRPRLERHPDHPYALAEQRSLAMTHYMIASLWWLLTSPSIPFRRKRLIFRPWFERLWFKKKKIARELLRFVKVTFSQVRPR